VTAQVTDINAARSPLSYALRYIRLGWWVLPLGVGIKKPFGSLVHNGFHDATNDPEVATRWWTRHPDAGIGVAVRKSGLVAVDIDPRNGGIETMDAIEAKHGPLVSDVLAFTGGGGEHRVFAAQLVESLPGKLGPGVDLKADGYICVEPTFAPLADPPHLKPYAWEASSDPLDGVVPTTLPSWIRDLGRAPMLASSYTPPAVQPINPQRLASAREALAHIASDDRDTWVKVGAAICNEMPGQDGFSLWDSWSQGSPKYDPQDAIRVWRSFKVKGLAGVGLNTVFAMAQGEGWKNTGGAPAAPEPEIPEGGLVLTLEQLHARAAATRWAVKGIIPEQAVGFIYGASQAFKSFVTLDYALHRAYGMKWLGRKTKQATPIYLAAEGGAGLMRRIEAWHRARSQDWRKCPMRVVIVPLTLRTQSKVLREAIEATGIQPGDVIVDTMSQTFTGDENSNDQVAEWLRILGTELRDGLACTVTIVHHTGHSANDRMRGASAMHSNADFALGVSRDGKELLATVEFAKVKDAERPDPQTFELSVQLLGKDEDGDAITSLAARHINNAEALVEAHKREGAAGRGGRNMLLVSLAQNGMPERELRKVFYDAIPEADAEARKKAFYRARDWAVKSGLLEFAGEYRHVILLKKEAV
jgi:AAA domain/Bifunctional DNA primase/polymerase, N-terminal/Primase C terminal 2 (PriCT-2)